MMRLFLSCLFLMTGCSDTGEIISSEAHEGVYVRGFEASQFEPCELNETWWMEPSDDESANFYGKLDHILSEFESLHGADNVGFGSPAYYLKVQGAVTEKGEYGHLSYYDREITVSSTDIVREASPDEVRKCATSKLYQEWADRHRLNFGE